MPVKNALTGWGVTRADEGKSRARSSKYLMLPHPLTNFEIQKYSRKKRKLKAA